MRELRSLAFKEIAGEKYVEKFNFAPGLLPVERDVIEMMVYQLNPNGLEEQGIPESRLLRLWQMV